MPDWLYGLLMFVLGAAFEHWRMRRVIEQHVKVEVKRQMTALGFPPKQDTPGVEE